MTGPLLDVFSIYGQSNAEGRGTVSQATPVIPGTVMVYNNGPANAGLIAQAVEPIMAPGGSGTGSMWSAFGATYYALTGRMVLLVPCAFPGAPQSSIASPGSTLNWDASGVLSGSLIAATNNAISAATGLGYAPILRGIAGIEGEADAAYLVANPSTYTSLNYRAAYIAMIARYRVAFPNVPVFNIRIGSAIGPNAANEPGMAQIRAEQEWVSAVDPLTPMVYRGATSFAIRGMLGDGAIHWSQRALNEAGSAVATWIANSNFVPRSIVPTG